MSAGWKRVMSVMGRLRDALDPVGAAWQAALEQEVARRRELEKAALDALDAIDNYAADDLGLDHELHALVESWRRALLRQSGERS